MKGRTGDVAIGAPVTIIGTSSVDTVVVYGASPSDVFTIDSNTDSNGNTVEGTRDIDFQIKPPSGAGISCNFIEIELESKTTDTETDTFKFSLPCPRTQYATARTDIL